jgi:CRISPR-associated protein Csx14
MNKTSSTLVVLMGGQPQVVTFLLDLLLDRGERIDQVLVVYLASNPRYQAAFRKLADEFVADRYRGQACHLRGAPIHSGAGGPGELDDIRNNHEVEIARQEIQRLLAGLKAQGQHLHIGLSGGRRIMGFLMISAAMQYLTPLDSIWHIYTPAELAKQAEDGAIMHVPPDQEVQLIEVPFVPWVSYFPGLETLLKQSTQQMGEARHYWLDHTERARCAQVWDALSRRQRDVLTAFAAGQTRQETAASLSIEPSTVDTHREAIVQECSKAWSLEQETRFDASFFRERFGPFLDGLKRV